MTLSDKRKKLFEYALLNKEELGWVFDEIQNQDKEFIKKLKEEKYPKGKTFLELMEIFQKRVDELAGEELTNHSPLESPKDSFSSKDKEPEESGSRISSGSPKGCGKIFEYKRKGIHITGFCGDTNYTDGFIPLCPSCQGDEKC